MATSDPMPEPSNTTWHTAVSQLRERLANTLIICDAVLPPHDPSEALISALIEDLAALQRAIRRVKAREAQRVNGHGD